MLSWFQRSYPIKTEYGHQKPDYQELEAQFTATLKSLTSAPPADANENWRTNAAKLLLEATSGQIDHFTQWRSVRDSMFVGNEHYVGAELARLKSDRDWKSRWRPAICEDAYGAPEIVSKRDHASGNTIHHAHHILTFERETGTRLDDYDAVLEFGGGYGSLARVVRKLGFTGAYVIHDLPHYSALQRLFLSACGVSVDAGPEAQPGVVTLGNSLPQFEKLASLPWKRPLFVATWSLSETPLEIRNRVCELLPKFAGILMGYQAEFGGVDNHAWFGDLEMRLRASHIVRTPSIPRLDPKWGRYAIAHKKYVVIRA